MCNEGSVPIEISTPLRSDHSSPRSAEKKLANRAARYKFETFISIMAQAMLKTDNQNRR